jgi:hypothetical protein
MHFISRTYMFRFHYTIFRVYLLQNTLVSKCTGPIYKYVLWYGVKAEYMLCVKNDKIHIS